MYWQHQADRLEWTGSPSHCSDYNRHRQALNMCRKTNLPSTFLSIASMPAESRSAQRPRGWKRSIAKACDSCRRRKAKCDGARPSCSRCGLIELECVYADMAKEGAVKRRRIDPDYVLHLEERLRHVEERLSRCTTDTEDCDIIAAEAATPGSTSPRGSPSANRNGGPEQAGPSWLILDGNCQANRSSLSDQVDQSTASAAAPSQSSVLVKGQAGELRYFGPSSSMSVLSPNGLKWIAKQTSDPSLPRSLKTSLEGGRKWTGWSHPVIKPMLETKAIVPLPSWNHTIDLVNSYFESDHKALPIFHHPTFMTLLGQQYSQNATTDPCWWASINAVLAISQRRRDEQEPVPNTSAKEASWRYAKNALDVVLSILMCNTSIMSVQALTALSYYFIGTPNPQPCYFLASAAVRTAQAIGLHELAVHASIGAFERKQRQMVFWAAAILDQSTTFRTGRPAAQALHSVRVGLPRCQTGEGQEIRLSDGQSVILDTFYLYAWMAKIQSEIYHRLYSTPHESRPKKETAAVVQDLNERLESWRSAIPLQVRPGWTTKVWCLPVNLHLARLHLDYYYCIVSVHTIYGVRSYDTAQDNACSDNSALPDSSSWPSFRKCLEAAESITIVLELIPEEADSFAW